METNTETTETPIIEKIGITCPKCLRKFPSAISLRMHNARVHTKRIKVPGQKTAEQATKEKEQRREYQRKLRERYKREGRDSRGYWPKGHPRKHQPYKWTPAQRAKFKRTMGEKRKRMQPFVYPLPDASLMPEPKFSPPAAIKFCPHCGNNIEKYL